MHSSKVYHATLLYRSFCVGMYIGGKKSIRQAGQPRKSAIHSPTER